MPKMVVLAVVKELPLPMPSCPVVELPLGVEYAIAVLYVDWEAVDWHVVRENVPEVTDVPRAVTWEVVMVVAGQVIVLGLGPSALDPRRSVWASRADSTKRWSGNIDDWGSMITGLSSKRSRSKTRKVSGIPF